MVNLMIHSESMKQWDGQTQPGLHNIRWACERIQKYANDVQQAALHLPCRPAWQTWARDDLDKAERELTAALARVRDAQRQYDNLPRMMEAAE